MYNRPTVRIVYVCDTPKEQLGIVVIAFVETAYQAHCDGFF